MTTHRHMQLQHLRNRRDSAAREPSPEATIAALRSALDAALAFAQQLVDERQSGAEEREASGRIVRPR